MNEKQASEDYADKLWNRNSDSEVNAWYTTSQAWVAGRESLRAEQLLLKQTLKMSEQSNDDLERMLKAERERSAKLIEALKEASCQSDAYMIHFLIDEAIAQYEAAKCSK